MVFWIGVSTAISWMGSTISGDTDTHDEICTRLRMLIRSWRIPFFVVHDVQLVTCTVKNVETEIQ